MMFNLPPASPAVTFRPVGDCFQSRSLDCAETVMTVVNAKMAAMAMRASTTVISVGMARVFGFRMRDGSLMYLLGYMGIWFDWRPRVLAALVTLVKSGRRLCCPVTRQLRQGRRSSRLSCRFAVGFGMWFTEEEVVRLSVW